MTYIETKVIFESSDTRLAVELISDAFYTTGVTGVVVEDPEEVPAEGWGDGPVCRAKDHAVIGFFPGNDTAPALCRALEEKLEHLKKKDGIVSRISYRDIDEQDWAESWKAFFWPERISPTLVVKPTWRHYRAEPGETVIEIDPGMAFGTGTHPTTRLCINMMEAHLQKQDAVLDIGTGSGILLIAAAKLGAARLYGIDTDPVAVGIARGNLLCNGVRPDTFTLHAGEAAELECPPFNFIVANILSEVILSLLDTIPGLMAENGIFVCSGIIRKNGDRVRSKMTDLGFQILDQRILEEWVALVGRGKISL